ncbi:non-ribosomal peptide synthetase [Streptomyces sp. NL15-2K]|nr:non-ribosomal peptide synthetase [Streptomyces sp. NL15-2K]
MQRLDELLAAAAVDHPDRPAVVDGDRTIRYARLDRLVDGLADGLVKAGVRPGDRVGVYVTKSLDALAVLYAALRVGAVAAPMEVTDPPERTARIVRNAGLDMLVTSTRVGTDAATALLGPQRPRVVRLGPTLQVLAFNDAGPPRDTGGGYLLFTSGSTGTPKGVLLSHRNVLHFVEWAVGEFGAGPTDRIGSQSALTFDLSTFDIFGSAMAGACLCLMPEPYKSFPRDAVRWLAEERISLFYAVPTLWMALLDRGGIAEQPPPDLRVIAFAGEPFPQAGLQRYTEVFADRAFYNLYGPTETNVCTFEKLPRDWSAAAGLSIGRPISDTRVELVDDEGRAGSEGEIAVAGPSVFLGYLQDGELHEQTVPVVSGDGTTVAAYLTGDLARYGSDGKLYLRGRRDHQIKRRGHRIELPEIESVVREIPGVRSCAAVWRPDVSVHGEIWLFVVTDGVPSDQVRRAVGSVLQASALPDRIELVDALPENGRGKIDREALASRLTGQGVTP